MARIAVINDDTAFLTLMNDLLNEKGWETVIHREGSGAFSAVKEANPDLIILDIRMQSPDSGWSILELLKLDPSTRHIPVVVCSAALDELQSKEAWLRAHNIATLFKPFDIDDLYATVEQVLAGG